MNIAANFQPVATILAIATFLSLALSNVAQVTAAPPVVRVELQSGRTLQAEVAQRTNEDRLWLTFRTRSATLQRPVDWDRITAAQLNGQSLSSAELRDALLTIDAFQLTASQDVTPNDDSAPASENPEPAEKSTQAKPDSEPTFDNHAEEALQLLFAPPPPRVTSVRFDAFLANWDGDVEADGLVLHVLPVDAAGRVVPATGVVTAELFAQRRIAFNAAPHKQGRRIEQIGRWTKRMLPAGVSTDGCWFKLPFQADHPEFDTELGRTGLVHVRLAVSGHGVFESSIDGIRIRPFAPLRDDLERVDGRRFLAVERTGRGKRKTRNRTP